MTARVFRCQDCGNTRAMLETDLETGRIACYDRELCEAAQEMEKAYRG